MAETTETTPVVDTRKIVEECVEFVRRSGQNIIHTEQMEKRAAPRILFTHPIRYSPDSVLSEDRTKPAHMLDVSLGGIRIYCRETLMEDTLIHVCLPLQDGKTAWVKGTVIYCRPDVEHYRAGIAFILEQD